MGEKCIQHGILACDDASKDEGEAPSEPPLCDLRPDGSSMTNHEMLQRTAYSLSIGKVASLAQTGVLTGLSSEEARHRLHRDGPNKIRQPASISKIEILLRQVSNSLTVVLAITMAISFIIDDFVEGSVIGAVILLNIVIGFVQDYRAEAQILSLQALSAPECKVIRDSQIKTIKANDLVIGDVVQLSVGDVVPADVRLVETVNTTADEALLTGESQPVNKNALACDLADDLPLGDKITMCYAATTMTQGRAKGIIVATGLQTEVGAIASLLNQRRSGPEHSNAIFRAVIKVKNTIRSVLGLDGTPLQVKLSKFALILFALAILLSIIVFSINLWDVDGEVLIYGICVAVAVIPESLIAVLTITVAVGTKAMAKGNVIVRKLQALEAIGGVTHCLSDKTGTLTQGRMTVRMAWAPTLGTIMVSDTSNPFDPSSGNASLTNDAGEEIDWKISPQEMPFIHAMSICNLSSVFDSHTASDADKKSKERECWKGVGEPTEIALNVFARRLGIAKDRHIADHDMHLVRELAFDSALKKMTVLYHHQSSNTIQGYSKGATEKLLPNLLISDMMKTEILQKVEIMAAKGLRVLCIATRRFDNSTSTASIITQARDEIETDLEFQGLVGIYDPPRPESASAVKECQAAGISVHMLTGDHLSTAMAIAKEVCILDNDRPDSQNLDRIMSADVFDKLSDGEIDAMPELPLVLARCSPATKVKMVDALHRRKAFTVMTGDGVNDSPSLKRSDVGIAMGLNGSDVAKDAADMILTDDNFASIVKAIREGRRLFDNIQKFLLHLLISNISQVLLLLIGLAFKGDDGNSVFPLSPLEILWVNLITSSFLAIGLGLEECSPDIMQRPPHSLRVGVFTRELIVDKMVYGTIMGLLCLVAFVGSVYGSGGSLGAGCNTEYNVSCDTAFRARAATYATLTYLLLVTAWEVKHFRRSLFNMRPEKYRGPFSVMRTVTENRFLFWAVVAGAAVVFPVIYLPEVDHIVFKHQGITWEWGLVFGCVVVYVALVEGWKALKRRGGFRKRVSRESVGRAEDTG